MHSLASQAQLLLGLRAQHLLAGRGNVPHISSASMASCASCAAAAWNWGTDLVAARQQAPGCCPLLPPPKRP